MICIAYVLYVYIYRLSDAAPTPQTQRHTWACSGGKGDPCPGSYEWSRARVSRGLMNGPGTRGPVTHEPYCNTAYLYYVVCILYKWPSVLVGSGSKGVVDQGCLTLFVPSKVSRATTTAHTHRTTLRRPYNNNNNSNIAMRTSTERDNNYCAREGYAYSYRTEISCLSK